MKTMIAGLLLFGAQAMACPNLAGNYTCTYEGQTSVIQMSQTENNGVTVYTIKDANDPQNQGGSLPADNNTYRLQDSDQVKNGTIRGWCEAEAFKIEQTGEYYDKGQHIGNVQAVISMYLTNGNLVQDTAGTFTTPSGNYPINSQVTCTPN